MNLESHTHKAQDWSLPEHEGWHSTNYFKRRLDSLGCVKVITQAEHVRITVAATTKVSH